MSPPDPQLVTLATVVRGRAETAERLAALPGVEAQLALAATATELAAAAEQLTAAAVAAARAGDPPAAWQQIADALKVSRQAAHERYR